MKTKEKEKMKLFVQRKQFGCVLYNWEITRVLPEYNTEKNQKRRTAFTIGLSVLFNFFKKKKTCPFNARAQRNLHCFENGEEG